MKLLDKNLVDQLSAGDVISYEFETTLNGRKVEDVIFLEKTEIDENEHHRFKNEVLMIPALKIRNLTAPGNKYETSSLMITIPSDISDDCYRIWTNGWNKLEVTHVNGKEV